MRGCESPGECAGERGPCTRGGTCAQAECEPGVIGRERVRPALCNCVGLTECVCVSRTLCEVCSAGAKVCAPT